MRYENGDEYQGSLFDGVRHGKGRMLWKCGDWYEGDWLRDRRHGEGLEQIHGHTESGVKYSLGSLVHRQASTLLLVSKYVCAKQQGPLSS